MHFLDHVHCIIIGQTNKKYNNILLQMSTSGGGGYCDCGDLEAWKSDPNCELHNSDVQPMSDQVCIQSINIKNS